jgi:DNA-3-methyladenine glycosylase II
MTQMPTLSIAESKKIAARIRRIEPKFGDVIRHSGPCPIGTKKPKRSNFESLASSILSQQLSTKAAATIIGRVEELSGGSLNAAGISHLTHRQLRSAGCSGAKTRAISELAEAAEDKTIPINSLHKLSDEEIYDYLLPLFGIGQWTVEMFLIFQLGRVDVWPVGDLGVRRGWEKVHRLRNEIEPERLHRAGERFAPYRSHLAWYCWRALEFYSTSSIKKKR